ncbi:biotin--[acetyl-CoA-carboxylase] ligase [Methylobacterium haplocladii]|uniref:biotin--[biotin carboxyl-carrier protein] ligase n=1 Tax=Methylobacterium haplocladii TaxID=1176176 RepID=A0A512ISY3_9HYPH|nr:biotin--[acetyl-CoA-carboxylase] ligase [Methylobacterium haplocladii]GEP00818.1 biotin--[acetyl-CoA-carboxylase] ligase [Methylobacterium haplocladii]GJD85208.1 Bifunctional ligase/repressor BirA [Methylobacterium haplocladii]GLS59288.1 biotin--[acetyl-CoA-carboxylase] ligase [Methylobacterium haplocladii]
MAFRLSPEARAAGYRLHAHDVLGSTNTEALEQARAGEAGPLWVVAHRQSEGRGRRGSAWVSPEGNLAASLLFPIAGVAPDDVATLGFVAGLALINALDDVALQGAAGRSPPPCGEAVRGGGGSAGLGRPSGATPTLDPSPQGAGKVSHRAASFQLKWPNDVLASDKKLAGILLEAEGRRAVVIGFGINVLAVPEGLPYAATSLAALGCAADAAAVLDALSRRFVEAARIWNKGHGFSSVRQRWLQRAAGIGAPVTVRLPDRTLNGLHDGIDERGRLMILAPDGMTHTVTAGEVHFGSAATAA